MFYSWTKIIIWPALFHIKCSKVAQLVIEFIPLYCDLAGKGAYFGPGTVIITDYSKIKAAEPIM